MPWPVLVVGALITAGAALAPDLDHKSATISRAFGPVSRGLCEIVDKLSHAVYKATKMRGDSARNGGHRTLTHTWVWAVLIGSQAPPPRRSPAAGGRCWRSSSSTWCSPSRGCCGGPPGCPATSWSGCSARPAPGYSLGVLDKPGNGSDWLFAAPGQEYLWLGLPIVLGALVHDIGDALTVSGCPILWPIPIGRKRWYPIGPPKAMRFRAGSWVELKVLMPVFMVLGGVGAAAALNFI